MSRSRPAILTLLCWLILIGSFFGIPFSIGTFIATIPDRNQAGLGWSDQMLLALSIFGVALYPLAAYYMLNAKNWARWLMVALVLLDTSAAILLFVTGENYPIGFVIRDVLRVPFVLIVVFLPLSNRYFAGGGRPEWQIEDAEDAADAEKAAKAERARARKS